MNSVPADVSKPSIVSPLGRSRFGRGVIWTLILNPVSPALAHMLAADTTARRIENISGHIEADNVLAIEADTVINRKKTLTRTQEQTDGTMSVICYDCSGDHHNVDYVATETFERRITQDSPASILQGNGGLLIRAETLGNLCSVLASGGDLLLDTRYLVNVGATANTAIRTRTWNSGRVTLISSGKPRQTGQRPPAPSAATAIAPC